MSTNEKLISIVEKFKGKKVLVIGDIMLDKSIRGDVSRISPEAPVQVVNVDKEEYMPGGAANVAANIAALEGNVYIAGTVGNDEMSKVLVDELKKRDIGIGYLVKDNTRPTITKIRVIARSQQLLRIDYEKGHPLDIFHEKKIIEELGKLIAESDIVIVSDYGKGLLSKNLMANIVNIAKENGKYVIVDPKPVHREYYYGCSLMTPNYDEACMMSMLEEEQWKDIMNIGEALVKKYKSDVLITRGERGMSLFKKDGGDEHIPTKAVEVYDVTGAGDTVVAALSLAIASGATLEEAAMIANHAAGVVVGKIGTSIVTTKEIIKGIKKDNDNNGNNNGKGYGSHTRK